MQRTCVLVTGLVLAACSHDPYVVKQADVGATSLTKADSSAIDAKTSATLLATCAGEINRAVAPAEESNGAAESKS